MQYIRIPETSSTFIKYFTGALGLAVLGWAGGQVLPVSELRDWVQVVFQGGGTIAAAFLYGGHAIRREASLRRAVEIGNDELVRLDQTIKDRNTTIEEKMRLIKEQREVNAEVMIRADKVSAQIESFYDER